LGYPLPLASANGTEYAHIKSFDPQPPKRGKMLYRMKQEGLVKGDYDLIVVNQIGMVIAFEPTHLN